jgi:hypothetical protein
VRKAKAPPKDEEQRQRRMAWSVLLRRSFAVDVLNCPACGGRRELLAVIEHKPTVTKILQHLGLPSELPAFAAPSGPPLFAGLERSASEHLAEVDGQRRVVADVDFIERDYG